MCGVERSGEKESYDRCVLCESRAASGDAGGGCGEV